MKEDHSNCIICHPEKDPSAGMIELLKDKARLDWAQTEQQSGVFKVVFEVRDRAGRVYREESIRVAIDKAMGGGLGDPALPVS